MNPSPSFDSTPMAPMMSSSAWPVVAVLPDDGDVSFPVAPAVWSAVAEMKPENSSALRATAATDGYVTTIVSPLSRRVTMRAEKTTVRTPLVPDPFTTSTSFVYTFPCSSWQVTAPGAGSRATLTMTVCPTATPLAGTVTEIDVPVVVLPAAATCLTSAIAPNASDAGTRHSGKRATSAASELVARVRWRSVGGR